MASQAQVRQQFIAQLESEFPSLENQNISSFISDNLISPISVPVSAQVIAQAKAFAQSIEKHISIAGHRGIFNSYDFHLDNKGQLKLIEANTNAAFWILGYEMYKSQKKNLPIPVGLEKIKKNIESELQLFGASKKTSLKVAIIDENPPTQRLYVEFLVYQALFQSWGWQCDIKDYREDLSDYDFIYNRWTDFLFEKPESASLKDLYEKKLVCISPHPLEYSTIADKSRFMDFRKSTDPVILQTIPEAILVTPQNAEEIWTNRKQFFFKPLRSFGSKQTFKGASVSNKVFQDMLSEPFLAQEFVPAPEVSFENQNYKYDLRFYFYRGEVEHVIARTYQGQVTNLRTPHGGFSCVEVI